MTAAPGWSVGREELPDLVRVEIHNRPEHEAAREIVVWVEARAVVISRDHPRSRRALAPSHAQQQDDLSSEARLVADVSAGRKYLHPIGAPAERTVGGGVSAADQIDPERLVRTRCRRRDHDGQVECGRCTTNLVQAFLHVADDQRTLDERVVRDDMNGAAALAAGDRQQVLHHEVRDERTVLATGESDDPGLLVRLRIFVGDLSPNRIEHALLGRIHCTCLTGWLATMCHFTEEWKTGANACLAQRRALRGPHQANEERRNRARILDVRRPNARDGGTTTGGWPQATKPAGAGGSSVRSRRCRCAGRSRSFPLG